MYQRLADDNDAHLVPALMKGVLTDPSLKMADGLHPNAEGQVIMADNVWDILKPVLKRLKV